MDIKTKIKYEVDYLKDSGVLPNFQDIILDRMGTTSNVLQSEFLYKGRYKRFCIYKNSTGNFNNTYYQNMIIELALNQRVLSLIRKMQNDKRDLRDKFISGRINFIVKNDFWYVEKMLNFKELIKWGNPCMSFKMSLQVWSIELKYKKLKANRHNCVSAEKRFCAYERKLKKSF